MKIAIVSCNLHYPWGGMDILCTQTAAAALEQGHEVFTAVSPLVAQHPAVDRLRQAGARIHVRNGFTQFNGRRARWRLAVQHWLRSPHSLLAQLDAFAPDILVLDQGGAFDFLIETGLVQWLRKKQVPFVLICHSNGEEDRLDPTSRATAREIARGAKCFVFLSTHNHRLAEQQLDAPIPNAHRLRNSIDRPLAALPWPDDGLTRFAVVARIESAPKGLDVLVDALALALGDIPGWTVDFIGRGPDEASLHARARDRGIADRLRFCGFQSDIGAIWAQHHLLLLPSRREGCPRVMLEAFACARPVLMTAVGGASDWIKPDVNGFLCPTCEAESLAKTLRTAWSERSRWRTMGEAAHRASRELDPNPGRTLLSLLCSLGSNKTSLPPNSTGSVPLIGSSPK